MPLELQTKPIEPNAIMIPMILMQTGIINGKLHTSCQITLSPAKVDNPGTDEESWTMTGNQQTIYLSDVENLESDLESLKDLVGKVYTDMITLIDGVNKIRKVL